jgi:gluconolactonase
MRATVMMWTAALLSTATMGSAGTAIFSDGFESGGLCGWSGASPFYQESFSVDGPVWPAPWAAVGNVAAADVVGGRARFRPGPTGYSLARLAAPIATTDVEVHFTLEFEDVGTQGVGFYVRQNGGYLAETSPAGQGYAVFVEGFRGDGIGVWKEIAGTEIPLAITFDQALGLVDDVPFRVRFRVNQVGAAATLLQAKVWPVGDPEPNWQVSFLDATPELQGISGGIALDSWSSFQSPNPITAVTFVDDVVVEPLCNPLAAVAAPALIGSGFQFTEGPLWRGDHLLFTDIDGDTIERLDLPAGFSTHRTPSGRANGLATAVDGALLSAEHQGRRIAREDPVTAGVTTVVETWNGLRFNSPNDIAVRADGTIYFTDPDYGLANPGDREIAFNGLFRLPPVGLPVAEWQGVIGVNQPNGVILSPDQTVLYVTDTHQGQLLAFDVAADGALSGQRVLRAGLTIPDGLCLDAKGNVWIATWAPSLEVVDPSGVAWGSVAVPEPSTNCSFGGPALDTIFVTAGGSVYSVAATYPGLPSGREPAGEE